MKVKGPIVVNFKHGVGQTFLLQIQLAILYF